MRTLLLGAGIERRRDLASSSSSITEGRRWPAVECLRLTARARPVDAFGSPPMVLRHRNRPHPPAQRRKRRPSPAPRRGGLATLARLRLRRSRAEAPLAPRGRRFGETGVVRQLVAPGYISDCRALCHDLPPGAGFAKRAALMCEPFPALVRSRPASGGGRSPSRTSRSPASPAAAAAPRVWGPTACGCARPGLRPLRRRGANLIGSPGSSPGADFRRGD